MGILSRIFGKGDKAASVKSAYDVQDYCPLPQGSLLSAIFGSTGLSYAQAMELYRTNSTVATAVDLIADNVEQIRPVLALPDGSFIEDDEMTALLAQPNFFDTWQEFIGQLCRHYLLTHNAFLGMLGNVENMPLELYAVKPQNIFTMQAVDLFPSSYTVVQGPAVGSYQRTEIKRRARFLDGPLREMYHIMGFSSRDTNLEGDSPLEAAFLEAKQQIEGRFHNLSVIKQGGRLSLIISYKDEEGEVDADQHKLRIKRVNEDLSGTANAGKIAIMSGAEATVTEVGKSNKDMDYSELDKTAKEAIYLRFGVPLPLVSTDASTFNNYETALFQLYEGGVVPTFNILAAGMTKVIIPRSKGIPPDAVISFDPESIPVLVRQKLEELKKRKDINVETPNELRAQMPNRDPIEGGDVVYQPANLVPVGSDVGTVDALTPEELALRNDILNGGAV